MKRLYFGEYLVRMKLISYKDLWEGLTYQKFHQKPLSFICLEHGVLTHEQVIKAMNNQGPKSFGKYCVEKGYLTKRQEQAMLMRQENQGLSIGKILVKQRKVTKEEVQNAFNEYIQFSRKKTPKKT